MYFVVKLEISDLVIEKLISPIYLMVWLGRLSSAEKTIAYNEASNTIFEFGTLLKRWSFNKISTFIINSSLQNSKFQAHLVKHVS